MGLTIMDGIVFGMGMSIGSMIIALPLALLAAMVKK